jgi:hypothetical protein
MSLKGEKNYGSMRLSYLVHITELCMASVRIGIQASFTNHPADLPKSLKNIFLF